MRNVDWAYFAGLFDGEGCVSIQQVTRKTATVSCRAGTTVTNASLRISNNNPAPLTELEQIFGGRVRLHSRSGDSWVWICQGYKALQFANGILPYTRIKTGQLEIYIAFADLKRKKALGTTSLSKKEIRDRERMIVKLKEVRVKEGGKWFP
jgi:hypothetical protein